MRPFAAGGDECGVQVWLIVRMAVEEASSEAQQETATEGVSRDAATAGVMSRLFSWPEYHSQTACKCSLPENTIGSTSGHCCLLSDPRFSDS